MRRLLLLPFLALTAACGGETAVLGDTPQETLANADAALVVQDRIAAESGYAAVLDDPQAADLHRDAWIGLYRAHLADDPDGACEAYRSLVAGYGETLDVDTRRRLIAAALGALDADVTNLVLNDALAAFPDRKLEFAKDVEGADLLNSGDPSARAKLAGLGYVND